MKTTLLTVHTTTEGVLPSGYWFYDDESECVGFYANDPRYTTGLLDELGPAADVEHAMRVVMIYMGEVAKQVAKNKKKAARTRSKPDNLQGLKDMLP